MAEVTDLLTLDGISKSFGGLLAVDDVTFGLPRDGYIGLIGPNGAGKSTLVGLISGATRPTSGRILFDGTDVTAWPAWKRARHGIARTFQANRLLPKRSVSDHILLALRARGNPGVAWSLASALQPARTRARLVEEALEPFAMAHLADERADQLSFGHQRLLGVAMAVTACPHRPALLLLDEPVAGMNETEVASALAIFSRLRQDGFALLLIEHNMNAVMQSVDRVVVLELGRTLIEGTPAEVTRDERVIEAYLGRGVEA